MDNKIKKTGLVILTAMIMSSTARMASANQGPMVTFRFDDGLTSQYNLARPILSKYNFPATIYIFTDPPEEGNWEGYMNWTQIKELHDVYGWEIGGHSKSHPDLTKLSTAQLIAELSDSKTILNNQGFIVKSFASPFGTYNNKVLSYIARFYESHNSAWPYDFNSFPFSDYEVMVQEVRNSTSLAEIKGWIDAAVLNKKWLVLLFHEIVESNPEEYEYLKNNFEVVVDYVNTKNVPVVNVSEALNLTEPNLILNPSFESRTGGWADGWLRTDSLYLSIDTNTNGAFPSPINSLKLKGSAIKSSVYTKDFISINPGKEYVLKAYFNCQTFRSGGVNVSVEEYDSQGKRLNLLRQTGIQSKYVGSKAVTYRPSQNAAKVLIWIESISRSNLTCYVDNVILTDTGGEANKNPVLITNIPDQSFDEDTILKNAFNLNDYFSDPDNDSLSYSYSGAKNVTVNISPEGIVDFSALANWAGQEEITFAASDGSLTAQDNITVIVNPINDAPVITSTPGLIATRDTNYVYDAEAVDIDGDVLNYSLITSPAGMTIDAATGLINWIPTVDQLGSHDITIQVSDGILTDSQSWTVVVGDVVLNLVLNPSFESLTDGWADGWLRTDALSPSIDTNNNGSLPYPKNSLMLVGSTARSNAYTKDFIGISPSKAYPLEVYFNCPNFTSGGVDVFIDEYDSQGKWLSWKWQTGIWSNYVGSQTTTYTPSQNAAKILIWIESAARSSLTCYVDNVILSEQ